ncbi:MAG: hypothetical protein K2H98_02640 [Duncaniella sp.]|nr:hypothetical protein [Duncaniella sp.]
MNNETQTANSRPAKEKEGKLSWVIPLLEGIIIIGYLLLGWSAISNFISSFDFESLFEDIIGAIYFLIISTIVQTILCFIPVFKSRGNMIIAVWNIVWLGFNLWGILTF